MTPKPVAVLISDIHYNIHTLPLADTALRQAVNKANELNIPLIIAGDLHDTKANMRAECVNAMRETFELAKTKIVILIGNHDKVNEKSLDHSLNFLKWNCAVVENDEIYNYHEIGVYCIAYQSDLEVLRKGLSLIPTGSTLIMHQGLQGSDSGDYIQDPTALTHEDVKDFRVISGHYHRRQDVKTGRLQNGAIGLFSYIGNPYTLGFGEASDPEKGFQILMYDGTLEFVPTNLRKHIVIDVAVGDLDHPDLWQYDYNKGDLLWVKVCGHKQYLQDLTKEKISKYMGIVTDFKLDLIPTDNETRYASKIDTMTQNEILDDLIDSKQDLSEDKKEDLKSLWKDL